MQPALTPEATIDARAAALASHYHAKGDLELMFLRQIAAAQFTIDSLQRGLNKLDAAADPTDRVDAHIDRLSRAQARTQRMLTIALKEFKDLQNRRGILQRFPEQNKDAPPLANNKPFSGYFPQIPPLAKRPAKPPTDLASQTHQLLHDPAFLAKHAPQLLDKIPGINPTTTTGRAPGALPTKAETQVFLAEMGALFGK